mgnify:FL=1|tara:strand:- start:75 stop:569 length:495 start_codon:yes stop_codon:yes gene_type:complete
MEEVSMKKFVSPMQEDIAGQFYLAEGTDGALYRMESSSKVMSLIANEGEWEFAKESQLEDLKEGMVVQEGLENLSGRKIVLSGNYEPNFVSSALVNIATKQMDNNTASQMKGLQTLSKELPSDVPLTTVSEDRDLMPTDDSEESLKDFFLDDAGDLLSKEIEKL